MDIRRRQYFFDENFSIDRDNLPNHIPKRRKLRSDHIDRYLVEMRYADRRNGEGRTRSKTLNCQTSIQMTTFQTDREGPPDNITKCYCLLDQFNRRWVPRKKDDIYLRRLLNDAEVLLFDAVEEPEKYGYADGESVLVEHRQLIDDYIKPIYVGADVSTEYLDDDELRPILANLHHHLTNDQRITVIEQQLNIGTGAGAEAAADAGGVGVADVDHENDVGVTEAGVEGDADDDHERDMGDAFVDFGDDPPNALDNDIVGDMPDDLPDLLVQANNDQDLGDDNENDMGAAGIGAAAAAAAAADDDHENDMGAAGVVVAAAAEVEVAADNHENDMDDAIAVPPQGDEDQNMIVDPLELGTWLLSISFICLYGFYSHFFIFVF